MIRRNAKGRFVSKEREVKENTTFNDLPEELQVKIIRDVYKIRTDKRNALATQYHEYAKDSLNPNLHISLDTTKEWVDEFFRDNNYNMKEVTRIVNDLTGADLDPLFYTGGRNPERQQEYENNKHSSELPNTLNNAVDNELEQHEVSVRHAAEL